MPVQLGNGDVRDQDLYLSIGWLIRFRENSETKRWNMHVSAPVNTRIGRYLLVPQAIIISAD